jgi:short-subunit dehydrogenase
MKGIVLILGASSAIARAVANALATQGYGLYLAGRNSDELSRLASDIHIRYGVPTYHGLFDAESYDSHGTFLRQVLKEVDSLEGVVVAFGYLGEQAKAASDFHEGQRILSSNFVGACSILSECANYFEAKRSGFIVGITSVAGDRGRASNYYYGAAKGGLSLFLQGLRARLFSSGVHVMTVKPGFVDTGMTFGKPGMFLVASPEEVGEKIGRSLEHKKNVVYVPGFWRYIMWIIKAIPESLFRRLKL